MALFQLEEQLGFLDSIGLVEVGHSSQDESWDLPEMLCFSTFYGTQAFRPLSLCCVLGGILLALCSMVEKLSFLIFHGSFMLRKWKLSVISLPMEYSLYKGEESNMNSG